MKFINVIQHFAGRGLFEFDHLFAVAGGRRATLHQQLGRWKKEGLVIHLRRGIYALPDKMTPIMPNTERIANVLHGCDSYVTGLWQMNRLGLFPEGVNTVTSVTTGNTAKFETPLGNYTYYRIEPRGFFGYETKYDPRGQPMTIACPEKAILDFFWLKKIEWDETEFRRWRIEDPWGSLNHEKIESMARQWGAARLIRAARKFTAYLEKQKKETTTTGLSGSGLSCRTPQDKMSSVR